MRICFLIAAHDYPALLARLVQRIQSPSASILIHIDKRRDIRPFQELFLKEGISGIQWVRQVNSSWGSFGQVNATLGLLREAIATEADRYVLLSGQDYPLMSPRRMEGFFDANPDRDFITCAPLPWEKWPDAGGLDRLQKFHFDLGRYSFTYPHEIIPGSRLVRMAYKACECLLPTTRALPKEITFYGGSNWWNLTRHSAVTLLEFLRRNPLFLRCFRFSKSADEIFFQTALLNSAAGIQRENDDLRCVFWDGRRSEFPAVLRAGDFAEIAASGKLFARKMHPQYSLPLLERIDYELLQK